MRTILLNWNTKEYLWESFKEHHREIQETGYTIIKWSTGKRKKLDIGDRVFLIKYKADGNGLVGSGFAIAKTFEDKHWDTDNKDSKTANYGFFRLDTLSENPFISSNELKQELKFTQLLDKDAPQGSGTVVPEIICPQLEQEWFKRTQSANPETVEQISRNLREGKEFHKISKYYERSRDARDACLKEYGYSCKICNFNFYEKYGEIGKNYIHVHHIVPLSEIGGSYIINPKKDLIPICPNCHSMIHSSQKVLSPEELKNVIKY